MRHRHAARVLFWGGGGALVSPGREGCQARALGSRDPAGIPKGVHVRVRARVRVRVRVRVCVYLGRGAN
jgi:hypothetical protein